MIRLTRRLPVVVSAAALVVASAMLAASCGSGDSEASKNAAIVNAITLLDNAGLHEIDESIKNEKTIPSDAQTTAQKLQAVTTLTDWPDELDAAAKTLATLFGEFANAVAGDNPDMARAAEASKKVHDAEHDFSHEVWKHLYEEAGVKTGSASGH